LHLVGVPYYFITDSCNPLPFICCATERMEMAENVTAAGRRKGGKIN
jgi:hypothetical protein